MTTKNQKGMGLIEALLAVGVLGGLALVINQFGQNASKVTNNLETNNDILSTLQQIQAVMANPENCKETFQTRQANNAPNIVQALKQKNAVGFTDTFKTAALSPTVTYGQKRLKIESYTLSDAAEDVDVATLGTTHLIVNFNRGKNGVQTETISKKVNLRVVVDGTGKITSCVAYAAAASDIWKYSSNNTDIFFNGGAVGVGIDIPTANLTVRATTFPLQPGIALLGSEATNPGWNRAGVSFRDSSSDQHWSVATFGSASVEGAGKFGINGGHISTTGMNKFIIDKEGDVGIGTQDPSCLFSGCPGGRVLHVHTKLAGFADGATVMLSSESIAPSSIVGTVAFGSLGIPGTNKRVSAITGNITGSSPVDGRLLFWTTKAGVMDWNMILTEEGNIWARGSVTATNVSSPSDKRLKRNIRPIKDSLEKISRLEGVTYNWIEKNKPGRQIGLIAQDVEQVFPEAVTVTEDGYKALSYQSLIAPMVSAIKELKMENEVLKKYLCAKDPAAGFCNQI